MLNIRTVILSATLAVFLLLAIPLATARTEVISDPAGDSASVSNHPEESADPNKAPIPSYRSRLDECFDVPLREVASCQKADQAPIPSYRSPLDECFDVPLSEAAACRTESQTLVASHISSYRYELDECSDVSIIELASCRSAGQAPIS
jgi:hypothetical protein